MFSDRFNTRLGAYFTILISEFTCCPIALQTFYLQIIFTKYCQLVKGMVYRDDFIVKYYFAWF